MFIYAVCLYAVYMQIKRRCGPKTFQIRTAASLIKGQEFPRGHHTLQHLRSESRSFLWIIPVIQTAGFVWGALALAFIQTSNP